MINIVRVYINNYKIN